MGPPPEKTPRFRRAPNEKRARIIGAAHELFSRDGYGAATTAEIAKLASEKRRLLMPGTLADRAVFHRDLGRAYLELRATRALMFETLGEFWRSWSDTRKIADEVRLEAHAAAVRATEVALDAATLAFRYAGGASVYRSHPLQRCLRDLNTAAQHRFVGDDCWELLGSQLLDRKSLWSR